MPDELPGAWIKDSQRCAYSLGWEYRRRGRPLDDNPFDPGHWKYDAFCDGWRDFKKPRSDCDPMLQGYLEDLAAPLGERGAT